MSSRYERTPCLSNSPRIANDALESGWCVLQTEWEDKPFEVSIGGYEGCLVNVIWMHGYLPVAGSHVQFCEKPTALNFSSKSAM